MSSKAQRLATFAFWSVPIGVCFNDCLFGIVKVEGDSMRETLLPSDLILVDKISYRWLSQGLDRHRRGDVVTLWAPDEPFKLISKRLIALEKDLVLNEISHETVTIDKGQCWVEGDNRGGQSRDSASAYGPVHLGLIQGKAIAIVWPPSRWRQIDNKFSSFGKVKVASEE
jgi:inner membrane protease subunit 2